MTAPNSGEGRKVGKEEVLDFFNQEIRNLDHTNRQVQELYEDGHLHTEPLPLPDGIAIRLCRSWLAQREILEEVGKEPCDAAVCDNAHTAKDGSVCLSCRARSLVAS